MTLALGDPVQRGIDGDAVEPTRHSGVASEGLGSPGSRNHRFLNGVRCILAVSCHPQRDEPQPVFVPETQLVERARVTFEMEGEELLVVYLGPVGHSRTVLTDKSSSGVSGGGEGRAAVGAWRLMRSRHVGAALE